MQAGHACLAAGRRFAPDEACHLVVLAVPSRRHLHDAVARIEQAGVRCVAFHEPDDGLGDTAACTEPVRGACRRVFRRYPLWDETASSPERGPPAQCAVASHFPGGASLGGQSY